MGTRGAYGFLAMEEAKITYSHFDSYPTGLGVTIQDFLRETSDSELLEIAQRIELVDPRSMPTPEQVKACERWTDLSVSSQSISDWYCLLRAAQGEPKSYKDGLPYMSDDREFLGDSLFCEWAYLINLQSRALEVYRGFNQDPEAPGRFAAQRHGESKYCGVRLIAEIPLDRLRVMTQEQFLAAIPESY